MSAVLSHVADLHLVPRWPRPAEKAALQPLPSAPLAAPLAAPDLGALRSQEQGQDAGILSATFGSAKQRSVGAAKAPPGPLPGVPGSSAPLSEASVGKRRDP